MLRSTTLALVVAVALLAVGAAAAFPPLVRLEADAALFAPHTHRGWTLGARAAPAHELTLTFALKQRAGAAAALERELLAVSDPRSPRYGAHLSAARIAALVAPEPRALRVLLAYLRDTLGRAVDAEPSVHGDWVRVRMTVAEAERALHGARFHYFTHRRMPRACSACAAVRSVAAYALPLHVAAVVDFCAGVLHFPDMDALKTGPRNTLIQPADKAAPQAHLEITPRILRKRYGLTDVFANATNNLQAVAQFLDQHFDELDLHEFFLTMFPELITEKVQRVVGPNHIPAGTEASLDIEYIMGVAAKVPTWFWSTGGLHDGQEPFLDWILGVQNTSGAPHVHSVSYGDIESSLSADYVQRINTEFAKVGALGMSILFASGDDGAGCSDSGDVFAPNFPASSPWVTAVGGTVFSSLFVESDELANSISGGGFSNIFPAPSYQTAAVSHYFQTAKHLPKPGMYNATGRGYPDIAALSQGFTIFIDALPMPGVAGTSAAAPTVSAVISMVNDVRLQNNKPTLGFLNPLLYQAAAAGTGFFDVTEDCNMGCGSSVGFCASAGWDPTTGLGTPKYQELVQYAMRVAP